ncbi:MAG: Asp-tRNA(Asn)/Glu-tRNA(Gln) amidotransferase GatCAB subunit B, partial [Gemmatimonadota bacterium]|nr:Asp-tRNA(Asn)/Glu-tRNA(Gln) amidotransferase GatCAB subunit B [Gemmatimonadota bacterium]
LTADPGLGEYFEAVARATGDGKSAANWVMGEVQALLNANNATVDALVVRPADLAQLIHMVRDGLVSHAAAKRVFALMAETGKPAAQVAHEHGLLQVGDDVSLAGWIDEVLAEHPDEATRYLAGERKLQGVLVGFVMKKSAGKADPKRVNQLLVSRVGPG